TVRALALGGLRYETPEHNGISSLAATMLDKGTPSHGAVQIAGEMESMASGYSGMSGRNTIGGALTGLSRYLVPTMERFAEALFHASVPEDEFERERIMHLRELKSRQDSLGAVNYDRFAAAFFHGHPYAMQSMGTPESVARIKADDVRAYLRRMIAPQQMSVAVVGDVHASEIVQMVEELFAVERAALNTSPSIGAPEARTGTTLVTGDLDKNQAHVIVGFDSPGIGSEDRYALDVLHAVLSGQGGRLFSELRDRQSLAYSVYASMLMGMEASSFTVNIGTSPEKIEQEVRGIFAQVQKLLLEPPTSEELAGAKQYLCGNHDIGLQRTSSRAMSFALNELYGVGWRSALEYSDRIQAVRVDDVTRLVEQYLDVEAAVVAVTKPAGVEVDAQLIEHVVGGRR
ncbi:MAG: pitrilysin family protein, partial [Myxococcota bacterium]